MNLTEFNDLLSFGDDTSTLMMLVWVLPLILFVFYGQRIQLLITAHEIKKDIKKLNEFGAQSIRETLEYVNRLPGTSPRVQDDIESIIDYFVVPPQDMDTSGIVPKVRAVLWNRESYTRERIKSILPQTDDAQRAKVQTLLEISSTLRMMHKVVSHLYLTAKKQKNYPLILPLQMELPFVMEQAEALRDGVAPFMEGQPVGDGIGPAVVGSMMHGMPHKPISYRMVYTESEIEGRHAILLKPKGPEPVTGKPDEALVSIMEKFTINAIIMVDAALKMEGEESGSVYRGFGAAIGGSGVERFGIEEIATKQNIPIFCVVIKQSIKESITLMTDTIHRSIPTSTKHIRDIILENTSENETVLVIGVGNTGGVAQ
ncbi:MAG: DUF1512 domain-containing protein [Cenarchaeum sp. SB0665_bin_23]|nr:DUF1512 domain-containing protein [Cenarchaeum sp. SB0665_bin_23]MYB46446.1 DUF1512 domain-containing protein [Cenarchaeum sp. SB0662_bin_33]MYC79137.1 DUF1512 domain-containing protein [Cenarchaeum sp. SB0661_bin_35]MYD58061.1 DUF1512 domain-containing protein [Cenarchaeum sp. SB0678_bin_8]MYG33387.1 DUF1512 domain-containing protein [Cenarchaeum sp. SB0677_bin_16]MYI51546.1 DUF1512 domain-containing protein [Cenarchaeum sp. SB0673_bin_9]MYJ28226.1 DUF1512 domain-containing protein [Cenar